MSWLLIVILAALSMLGALSIDAYLPALPAIGQEFSASPDAVRHSLTVYVLAFAFMTLFYGTLSDSFGRRPVVLISLIVYLVASMGAACAPSLEMLVFFRLIQGLSAGGGAVASRAIVGDLFTGAQAQRIMSWISVVFGLAPALAPVLGGHLLALSGWRSIFFFIAAFTLLLFLACVVRLPESLPRDKRQEFHLKIIIANYWEVASHPRFLFRIASIALAFSGIMVYVAAAPIFIVDILHLTETDYGWLFIPFIGGMTLGSLATAKVSHRIKPEAIIRISFVIMILAAAGGIVYYAWFPMRVPWAIVSLVFYAFGAASATPVMTMIAIEMFPKVRGLAASLQAFSFMLLFGIVSGLVAPFLSASPVRFALATAIGAVLSLACWLLAAALRGEPRHSEQ